MTKDTQNNNKKRLNNYKCCALSYLEELVGPLACI